MSSICTKTLVPGFDEQAQLMWQRFDAARSMTHTCEKQVGYAAPRRLSINKAACVRANKVKRTLRETWRDVVGKDWSESTPMAGLVTTGAPALRPSYAAGRTERRMGTA